MKSTGKLKALKGEEIVSKVGDAVEIPVYRGSSLYPCRAKLAGTRMGLPKSEPEWLKTAAEEGMEHEQIIKRKLKEEGWIVEDSEEEGCPKCRAEFGDIRKGYHYEVEMKGVKIIGHSDGKMHKIDISGNTPKEVKPTRLEIKSMSQFEYDRWMRGGWEEFPTYARQATAEWHGMKGCNGMKYIVKNRNNGSKEEYDLIEPPADINAVFSDVVAVEEWLGSKKTQAAIKNGMALELMPKEWKEYYNPSNFECRRCPYQHAFGCVKTVVFDSDKIIELLNNAEMAWLEADAEERAATAKKEEAREVFKTATIAKGLKEQPWSWGTLWIKYAHISRKSYVVKATEFDQLTVKKVKGADSERDQGRKGGWKSNQAEDGGTNNGGGSGGGSVEETL